MSLTTRIALGFDLLYQATTDLGTPQDRVTLNRLIELANGIGANQANMVFRGSRSLADGADETLDLYSSGTLLDPLRYALTMEKLKVLYIKNTSTEANLLIGGAETTPVLLFDDPTDIFKLRPGGIFLTTAPDADGIDLTTNKDLKLAHDGTGTSDLAYEIIAIGVD